MTGGHQRAGLLDDAALAALEASAVVANCAMNRERQLAGVPAPATPASPPSARTTPNSTDRPTRAREACLWSHALGTLGAGHVGREIIVFKSAEEREAERLEREAEQARAQAARAEQDRLAQEQRQRDAFLATPVGAATAARAAGEPFFEVQLEVAGHAGRAGFGSTDGRRSTSSSAATLGEIEKLGWRLEHAGYYFMITGETSTDRVFVTGQATAVTGVTIGVYLFRNSSLPQAAR